MANKGNLEAVFTNSSGGAPRGSVWDGLEDYTDDDVYENTIRALIEEAADFSENDLGPDREEATKYYYGLEPRLNTGATDNGGEYDSYNDAPEDEKANRSAIVSTDVRDTIMAILPSLMRIFAGTEHAVNFLPAYGGQDQAAKDATNYIRYKFWDENDGFMTLYSAIKDCLMFRIGVVTWWTEDRVDIRVDTFSRVTSEQIGLILSENESAQLENLQPIGDNLYNATVRYQNTMPELKVEAVPLDEFRVDRRAKSPNVGDFDIMGRDQYLRAGDLIALGYDEETVAMHMGASRPFTGDRLFRNPYEDIASGVFDDLVRYGDYYIRVDRDGDGVPELRRICTMGDGHEIVADDPVSYSNFAVFSSDPRAHTLIGDSSTDLTLDIQRINTNLIRGALDSLAQSINPRTAINETLTNVDDALNDEVGAIIRTRGAPSEAVFPILIDFVGRDAFEMKSQIDALRQSRTGISEASKGLDPKALQSTTMMGVDLIATGAQERIELIALILANTGIKQMYKGLLREITANPNKQDQMQVNGKWMEIDPSTFDPNMRVKVNPALGKGSDMSRLMALQDVRNTQVEIISKYGINNPVVGVQEVRNTIVDMLELANIKTPSRYFKEITPEIEQRIASAPTEPDPNALIAQAELEKVKKDIVVAQATLDQKDKQQAMDDDFRRDKLNVELFTDMVGILAEFATAEIPEDIMEEGAALNQPG